MLHLLSSLPLQAAVIERIGAGDDIVLVDAAVCAVLLGHNGNELLQRLLTASCRVYALQEMLVVYGIDRARMLAGVEPVDYLGFVDLTVKNPVIHSWC